ncbi:MAG TPA: hypothetical protein VKK61_05550, partial [Tepidisphaeraceae bacterium]|nr:hypothetical protein [Tepidisphaeraceae bacterium]
MIAARANEQAQSTTVLRGWRAAIFPLLILLIGGLAYSDSLRGVMVLDDQPSIVNNSVIRTLLPTRASIAGPPWTTLTGRPVTTFSFALNYRLGGLNVRGFHLTNIAIHLLAALTLWGIVRRTLRLASLKNRFAGAEDWLAAIIAMLWVAHPLTTSAVTYISQRAESLMSLFYCLTIYFFIRGASTATAKNVWFGLSLAACMVGMGTKEVMASAPLL